MSRVAELLTAASRSGRVHTLRRGSLPDIHGFVHAVGQRFALVEPVADRLDLDGHAVIRHRDVTAVDVTPEDDFYAETLARRGLRPTPVDDLGLDSAMDVLVSVERHFGLLVVHRERLVPDECEVGVLAWHDRTRYRLRWLTPMAIWEPDDRSFRFGDVTQVTFGGGYECALAMMAGGRPKP
jgi:hypothetical protein